LTTIGKNLKMISEMVAQRENSLNNYTNNFNLKVHFTSDSNIYIFILKFIMNYLYFWCEQIFKFDKFANFQILSDFLQSFINQFFFKEDLTNFFLKHIYIITIVLSSFFYNASSILSFLFNYFFYLMFWCVEISIKLIIFLVRFLLFILKIILKNISKSLLLCIFIILPQIIHYLTLFFMCVTKNANNIKPWISIWKTKLKKMFVFAKIGFETVLSLKYIQQGFIIIYRYFIYLNLFVNLLINPFRNIRKMREYFSEKGHNNIKVSKKLSEKVSKKKSPKKSYEIIGQFDNELNFLEKLNQIIKKQKYKFR
jgi:hypothetical protein